MVVTAAYDVREFGVVEAAQGLLRQLELLGLVAHHMPPWRVGYDHSSVPAFSQPIQVAIVINEP
jgi:hypothetical protein